MDKTAKIAIGLVVLLLVVTIAIDASKPKPINWSPTYRIYDKIPFGLYIFNQEINKLRPKDTINKISTSAFEYFNYDEYIYGDEYSYNTDEEVTVDTVQQQYIKPDSIAIVNDSISSTQDSITTSDENYDDEEYYGFTGNMLSISEVYNIDDQSTEELLRFAANGNSVFIFSQDFSQKLKDSLKFNTNSEMAIKDSVTVWLANKHFSNKKYTLNVGASNAYFQKIDTLTTTILGYHKNKDKDVINFVKIPYKKGYFYLSTQPAFFTNYHLLKSDNYKYVENVLSYIPNGQLYWLVKTHYDESSNSLMRFVLSQPALKWAWYLLLLGLITFIIFNAKRKQRIVPIIKPLPNTTVDFTKTIGNLYFQEGNHQNLVDKKIIYFLEKIRSEYHIDTTQLDDKFIERLQQKTGKNITDIQKVVQLMNYQRKSYHQSVESDLIELSTAMEKIIN